ncbi:MAG: LPS export ABC transporter periplasmic protein LptC [Chloracidobacterium sp.]|nr:LPS export ABC transporter periplasmic protein LptC [Chloracidobacterium sp.]
MVDAERKILEGYKWRAQLPRYLRVAAVVAAAAAVLAVVVGFFSAGSRSTFKLRSEHTQLSTEVTAEVSGYDRLESENGVPQYRITADYAKTFSDNHQEFTNIYLEVFDADGTSADKLRAATAVYIPEDAKAFTAYLNGNVSIETRDRLTVKTNNLIYDRKNDVADADESIEFERDGLKGRSFGASFKIGDKRVELLRDVEIETLASGGAANLKVNSGYASFDLGVGLIEFRNGLNARLAQGNSIPIDISSGRAMASLDTGTANRSKFKGIELFDTVRIAFSASEGRATTIESGYASSDSSTDRFQFREGVRIVADGSHATAVEGTYSRSAGTVALEGSVDITQGNDRINADSVDAAVEPGGKVRSAVARGDARIRRVTAERSISIAAPELNADFTDSGALLNANAIGKSSFEVVPTAATQGAIMSGTALRGIGARFGTDGVVEAIRTDGRTTIDLNAKGESPDAANKRLTADAVRTVFGRGGYVHRLEAAGDAELDVTPLNRVPGSYRTTVAAPRFDCDFSAYGNKVEACVAGRHAKVTRIPAVATEKRGTQNLTCDQLTVRFNDKTGDIAVLKAAGGAKFNELDRNASASEIAFTQDDEVVRLRGAEPTFWNDSGRAKAREIDIDTRGERSYFRGKVRTTYYSLKRASNAAPFSSNEKPFFITAEEAEFDHAHENGLYRGNARAWQGDNYIRAENLFLDEKIGRLKAEGRVETVLYNAKAGQRIRSVPVYASAGSLIYQRDERRLRYASAVDIRQGSDRLTASAADIFVDEHNDVIRTVAENDVVLTQPGRRATGDWAQFTSADEVAVIRGEPATIVDAERGSLQGREMTFRLKENRVAIESRVRAGNLAGRTRSVYKVNQ